MYFSGQFFQRVVFWLLSDALHGIFPSIRTQNERYAKKRKEKSVPSLRGIYGWQVSLRRSHHLLTFFCLLLTTYFLLPVTGIIPAAQLF